jgi:hypothetical protein
MILTDVDVRSLAAKLKGLHALLSPAEQTLLQRVLSRAADCAETTPEVVGFAWAVSFNPLPYLDAVAADIASDRNSPENA